MSETIIRQILSLSESKENAIRDWSFFIIVPQKEEYPNSKFIQLPSSCYENCGTGTLIKFLGTKESLLKLDPHFFNEQGKITDTNKKIIQEVIYKTLNLSERAKVEYLIVTSNTENPSLESIYSHLLIITSVDLRIKERFEKLGIPLTIEDATSEEDQVELEKSEKIIEAQIVDPNLGLVDLVNGVFKDTKKDTK